MKIIATGDFHARDTNPANRTDNYLDTLMGKNDWVMGQADDGDVVVRPGDIFNYYKGSDYLKSTVLERFSRYPNIHQLVIAGQHDQKNRSHDISDTPYGVLLASRTVILLDHNGLSINGCMFYGASYNEEIPEPKGKFNVLVIHRMLSDRDHWNGHVAYDDAMEFLKKYKKYNLIISGDNHKSFIVSHKNRHLVNCGSWMRSKIDQIDHKPMIAVYENGKLETKYIPIQPDVLKIEEVKQKKSQDDRFSVFAGALNEIELPEVNFKDNAVTYLKKNKIDKEVEELVWEAIP